MFIHARLNSLVLYFRSWEVETYYANELKLAQGSTF